MIIKSDRSWLCTIVMVATSGYDQNPVSIIPRHSAEDQARLQEFVTQMKSEQIFVEGDEYLIGGFDEEYDMERLQHDGRKDSKPLHRVELSSYSLGKFRASNQQHQSYLAWSGLKGQEVRGRISRQKWNEMGRIPDAPAHVDWHEAERYCAQLGEAMGLPFPLPTEVQWEYAARSQGKHMVASTDDGTTHIEGQRGINVATATDREMYARQSENSLDIAFPLPRDFRPPNPLGVYDTTGNDWEWMKDWYGSGYYRHPSAKDPQGPGQPVPKDTDRYYTRMLRSQNFPGSGRGLAMVRYKADPENRSC